MIKRSHKIKAAGAYAPRVCCSTSRQQGLSEVGPGTGALPANFGTRKRIYFSARQNSTFIAAEAPEYKDVGDLEYEANFKVWLWLISADRITLERSLLACVSISLVKHVFLQLFNINGLPEGQFR
jgi:hypothetical protein